MDDEAPPELTISVADDDDGWTVVSLSGEVDLYTSRSLRHRLDSVLDQGHRNVIIDLAGVTFLDSTGLGTMVGALRRARQDGGDLSLRSPRPAVLRVIEITGLTRVLPIRE